MEHLSEREKERAEVIPTEHSSDRECFSERLKFMNKDFLSKQGYNDQQLQHRSNNSDTYQRNDVGTSSSRSKYSTMQCNMLHCVWYEMISNHT